MPAYYVSGQDLSVTTSRTAFSFSMRTWTVEIARDLTAADIERARALARYRWGVSADVVAYDSGMLTFLAPDATWVGEEFGQAVERGEGVPLERARRTTRKKRSSRGYAHR